MEEKISSDLQIEIRRNKGPHKVSIVPFSQKLDDLVSVNRYEGIGSERMKLIIEETLLVLAPICDCLEKYGLVSGESYVSSEELRNVSALLSSEQILDLAKRDYVRK